MTEFDEYLVSSLQNRDSERALFLEYLSLISLPERDIYALEKERREFAYEIEVANRELENLKNVDNEMSSILSSKEEEWISQETELISLKSHIEQIRIHETDPIDENTIMYLYPIKRNNKQATHAKGSTSNPKPNNQILSTNEPRRIRSGETVVLETRLAKINKETEDSLVKLLDGIFELNEHTRKYENDLNDEMNRSREVYTNYINKIEDIQIKLLHTISEILKIRSNLMKSQRESLEEQCRLRKEIVLNEEQQKEIKLKISSHIEDIRKKSEREFKLKKIEYQQKIEFLEANRKNILDVKKKIPRNIHISHRISESGAELSTNPTKILQQKLQQAKDRYRRLQRRHSLEMEGFVWDLQDLRKKLSRISSTQLTTATTVTSEK